MQTLTRTRGRPLPALLAAGFLLLPAVASALPILRVAGGFTDKYGNLDQNKVPACKDANGNSFSCGPTAAVNSLVFLQNMYPGFYDTLLVPDPDGDGVDEDDMIDVAVKLAGLAYMDCVAGHAGSSQGSLEGVTLENFITGKKKYIEEVAPNRTIYKAQSEFLPLALVDRHHVMIRPLFSFMFRELKHGEDVEIVVGRYDNNGVRTSGHMLTLTKLEWLDSGPNDMADGQFGFEDTATMTFVDPLGGVVGMAEIGLGIGARLFTDYENPGPGEFRVIDAVISESPRLAPEPGTAFLIAFGIMAALHRRGRLEGE